MVNVRQKGQRGEREAASLVMSWALEVTDYVGAEAVELKRNLMQSRQGGYDLVGLEWLALEVKRHESLAGLPGWWRQTVKQAKPGQTPFLMYRQNRTPWRFRLEVQAAIYSPCGHSGLCPMVADVSEAEAKRWFQTALWVRLTGAGKYGKQGIHGKETES